MRTTVRVLFGAMLLAAVAVVGLAAPASASCAGSPAPSRYAFTGVVTATANGGRVATVRADSGQTVTVVGTPDKGSGATSVDRQYVVGARYEFHPLNGESPYQDNACTATRQIAAAASSTPGAAASNGSGSSLPITPPLVVAAVLAAALVFGLMLVRARRNNARASASRG